MAYQILATKLYSPPLQARLVARSALIERLALGVRQGRRLTLVSAPAGFGKSTLVSQWLLMKAESAGLRADVSEPQPSALTPQPSSFAWLSLDAGDNDPARFLVYLVAALQKADERLGREVFAVLQAPQAPPLLELVEALLNQLAVATNPITLVLDDYHLIKHREVHALTQLLLERQPATLHTVIITREDPPLPLPRMRVQGQLTEVRERELRFSQAEATDFFHQTMGLSLAESSVSALERQTEGWVAGLQLAAIALQEYGDEQGIQTFIATFAGNDRYVADYLLSEVLSRQPEAVQRFLLQTSILERMCAPLCDAILQDAGERARADAGGRSGDEGLATGTASADPFILHPSSLILQNLERANMFVIPLDNRRQWYRYHHLFGELLHHTLLHTPGMAPPALHRRASAWYEQHGFLAEAVAHACKAEDWAFVAELVERHAMALIGQSQVALLRDWIEQLPIDVVQGRPGLSIFHAWALMLSFRADIRPLVREKLLQAERALAAHEHPPLAAVGESGALVPLHAWVAGHDCAIRSQLLLASFDEAVDPHEVIRLSVRSLELLPEVERTIRATCAITIPHGYLMLGDVPAATQGFAEALRLALEAGNAFSAVTAYFYQARLACFTGDLERALAICREGWARLAAGLASPDQAFPAIRSLYVMQGVVLLAQHQFAEAQRLLELATNRVGYAPWVELIAYEALVDLWERREEPASVSTVLSRMAGMGPQIAACGEALRFRHLTRRAPLEEQVRNAAGQWAATLAPHMPSALVVNGIGPYQVDAEYIVLKAWLRVQLALGNSQAALQALTPILAVAEAQGFVQRVRELAPIRAAALQAGAVGAATLQREVLPDTRAAPAPSPPPAPLDALSEREVEVLLLLAQGLTLAEVAERLVLSPYTIKAHTQNIYAKLDAHSRVEAINRARTLGLIT